MRSTGSRNKATPSRPAIKPLRSAEQIFFSLAESYYSQEARPGMSGMSRRSLTFGPAKTSLKVMPGKAIQDMRLARSQSRPEQPTIDVSTISKRKTQREPSRVSLRNYIR